MAIVVTDLVAQDGSLLIFEDFAESLNTTKREAFSIIQKNHAKVVSKIIFFGCTIAQGAGV